MFFMFIYTEVFEAEMSSMKFALLKSIALLSLHMWTRLDRDLVRPDIFLVRSAY